MNNVIKFRSCKGIFGFLSNFYQCNFVIDDIKFTSVEQYYQYQKMEKETDKELILNTKLAYEARNLGKQLLMKKDFDLYKDWIMYIGVFEKFNKNKKLQNRLLDTGDKYIIEDAPWDEYWGTGIKGNG